VTGIALPDAGHGSAREDRRNTSMTKWRNDAIQVIGDSLDTGAA
jgi:hypothetical protein